MNRAAMTGAVMACAFLAGCEIPASDGASVTSADDAGPARSSKISGNLLESALVIGKSGPNRELAFLDQGGLSKVDLWRSYKVREVAMLYKTTALKPGFSGIQLDLRMLMAFSQAGGVSMEDAVLLGYNMILWKDMAGGKLASLENLKASLAQECGNWANAVRVTPDVLHVKNGDMECTIIVSDTHVRLKVGSHRN